MALPAVIACLDGSPADLLVIDVARRRAVRRGRALRLVAVARPDGPAVDVAAARLAETTSLQLLCRSAELPQPTRGARLRAHRRQACIEGDSVVVAEAHYGRPGGIDARLLTESPAAVARVQSRWIGGNEPDVVGVCITRLKDAVVLLEQAREEVADGRSRLELVYVTRREGRPGRFGETEVAGIRAEIAALLPGEANLEVVGGEPYSALTGLSHRCRTVLVSTDASIPRIGPDRWRYPDTGCPVVMIRG